MQFTVPAMRTNEVCLPPIESAVIALMGRTEPQPAHVGGRDDDGERRRLPSQMSETSTRIRSHGCIVHIRPTVAVQKPIRPGEPGLSLHGP